MSEQLIDGLKRWYDAAGSLDSHVVSSMRSDLGMASCGLSNPTDDDVIRLRSVADDEGLEMIAKGSGATVPAGQNFTVRSKSRRENNE